MTYIISPDHQQNSLTVADQINSPTFQVSVTLWSVTRRVVVCGMHKFFSFWFCYINFAKMARVSIVSCVLLIIFVCPDPGTINSSLK